MTISNQESFVTAEGNGVTTQFSYSFLIPAAADVVVTVTDISVSPAVDTVLLTTQYSITGLGSSAGGLVTYPLSGAALTSSFTITIARAVPIVQDTSISNQGNFYPKVVEGALDYLTMICQDLQGKVDVIDAEISALTRSEVSIVSNTTNAVSTIALLRSATVSAPLVGTLINVEGYYAANDGGGGLFYITNVNPGADDGGMIIHSNTAGFYYLRVINDGTVSVAMFGAKGDGTTNDATALSNCFNNATARRIYIPPHTYKFNSAIAIPANTTIYGNGIGSTSILRPGDGSNAFLTVNANGVTIRDLTYSGIGLGVKIGNLSSCSDIQILNVRFDSFPANVNALGNTVWLHTCQNVLVQGCYFYQITYGVLQESSFACSNIKVLDNTAEDMFADFVAMNGVNHNVVNLLVDGNTYLGSHSWPTPATEERFVSLTIGSYCQISNNFVQHCAGDAAIHIEDSFFGIVISDNMFVDCQVANGNDGWIYLLTSDIDPLITNNYFIKTSNISYGGVVYAVSTASNAYTMELVISGNICLDQNETGQFGVANLSFLNTGQGFGGKRALIDGNLGYGLGRFVTMKTTDNVVISNNTCRKVIDGVFFDNVSVNNGTGGTTIAINNNWFDCAGYSVRSGKNTNGTGAPYGWIVTNNRFVSSFGTHGGVFISALAQGWATGNWYGSNLVNTTIADTPGANTTQKNDFLEGTGLIHP